MSPTYHADSSIVESDQLPQEGSYVPGVIKAVVNGEASEGKLPVHILGESVTYSLDLRVPLELVA